MRSLFLLFATLLLAGCGSSHPQIYKSKNYNLNYEQVRYVGEPMILHEDGIKVSGKRWVGVLNSPDGWEHYSYMEKGSVKKELVYTGKSKNTIGVSYREYVDVFARPAFYHDLNYDLDESDTIVFRNYRIKVNEANNEHIKFVVLKD